MICTPVNEAPAMQDGNYAAVRFDHRYLKFVLERIQHAADTEKKWSTFYRSEYTDSQLFWLSNVANEGDVAAEDVADQAVDLAGLGSAWFEMPQGWEPEEAWKCRQELTFIGVGSKDIMYQFGEVHLDFTFETPTLSREVLGAMLARVSVKSRRAK
jgi:hypothetical protein